MHSGLKLCVSESILVMWTFMCRVILEEAESDLTGGISIEDVTLHNPGEPDTTVRRMVFTSNRNLVQSEAILVTPTTEDGAAAVAGKKAGSKKKNKAGKHNGMKAADGAAKPVVDHTRLACDYHKGIIAGLSLVQPHLFAIRQADAAQSTAASSDALQQSHPQQQQQQQQQQQGHPHGEEQAQQARPRVLVVGLGGGGLPVYLNQSCGMHVRVVELDPVVLHLARRHFSFQDSTTLQVLPPFTPCCDWHNWCQAAHWSQDSTVIIIITITKRVWSTMLLAKPPVAVYGACTFLLAGQHAVSTALSWETPKPVLNA